MPGPNATQQQGSAQDAWDTALGLVDNVDGYVTNARFGTKDAYAKAAGIEALMLMFDLVDGEGNLLTNQDAPPAYSVGKDWESSGDGQTISHPTRDKIVKNSLYGQLIDRVIKELKVPMWEYGDPKVASSWNGLGFHWDQVEHDTVSGDKRTQLMPTSFLGKMEIAAKVTEVAPEILSELTALAKKLSRAEFQKAALKRPDVVSNDGLMNELLDDSQAGFWAMARAPK